MCQRHSENHGVARWSIWRRGMLWQQPAAADAIMRSMHMHVCVCGEASATAALLPQGSCGPARTWVMHSRRVHGDQRTATDGGQWHVARRWRPGRVLVVAGAAWGAALPPCVLPPHTPPPMPAACATRSVREARKACGGGTYRAHAHSLALNSSQPSSPTSSHHIARAVRARGTSRTLDPLSASASEQQKEQKGKGAQGAARRARTSAPAQR